jgi:hypothetical protein
MSNPNRKAVLLFTRPKHASGVGLGLAAAVFVCVGLAGNAHGSEGRDRRVGVGEIGQSSVRCQTQNRPLDVGQGNYVLDRVTECAFVSSPSLALTVLPSSPPPQTRCGSAEVAPVEPAPAPVDPAALVQWTADRTRLGNTQYDRTLGAMRGVFPRRVR